jgi:hypothetical protein
MSQLTIANRSQLLAAATAITAVGLFLTGSPPARAHPMLPFPLAPACSQWGFPGNFALKQSSGDTVTFNSTGPAANGAMAEANDGEYHGPVTGGITGDNLDFTIPWRGRGQPDDASLLSKGRYTGSVGDDGFAHGDTHDELSPASAHWDSTVPLVCTTTAAPAAAAAPPPPPPLIGGLPADTVVTPFSGARSVPPLNAAPPTPVAPHDAVTVSFGTFSPFSGLPVTVTNSAAIAGTCTYDSTPGNFHHDFNLAPNGKTTFNITGIPTGTTYHVVVSCTGAFNGQTVEFGHVETDKSF